MNCIVFIHSCPDSSPMGVALSHGCVRMRNADITELFDQVQPGCEVVIG